MQNSLNKMDPKTELLSQLSNTATRTRQDAAISNRGERCCGKKMEEKEVNWGCCGRVQATGIGRCCVAGTKY